MQHIIPLYPVLTMSGVVSSFSRFFFHLTVLEIHRTEGSHGPLCLTADKVVGSQPGAYRYLIQWT
jgi:hypothetical protein